MAAAPISWGVCEAPGWGVQLPVDRVLGEARDLGITAMEQGAVGWLPSDPTEQRATLDGYGIELVGGFVPLTLHDPAQIADQLVRVERIATAMAAAGGRYLVSCPVAAIDDWHRIEMSDADWSELFTNLARVDDICGRVGLIQTVHPHVGALIETGDDFRRLIDSSGALVCLDTGHLTIGGVDVVAAASRHLERIGLVHLKDVDAETMARERAGELDLMAATRAGLFPALGDGIVPLAEVIAALEGADYGGWYVMETDVALTEGEPGPGEGPAGRVARSLRFLGRLTEG